MSTGRPPARSGPRTLSPEAQRLAQTDPDTAIVRVPELPASGARLHFTAGPRAGEALALPESDDLVVGRAAENPIAIPDTSVSRRHALLRRVGGGWTVSDLGSGNGTLVNGELLAGPRRLYGGEEIIVGRTFLRFVARWSAP